MTFRIDRFAFEYGKWRFDFKGVEGKGEYGHAVFEPEGLCLVHSLSDEKVVLVPGLSIPEDCDRQEASRIFARALHSIGWGPEVDKNNNSVDSETFIYDGWR